MRDCSSCCRGNDVTESSGVNFAWCGPSAKYLRASKGTIFYCCGPPNQSGNFSKRHGMYRGTGEESDSVELAIQADENENYDDVKIVEPDVPYLDKLPVDLHLGRSIEIHGKTFKNCNRFSINFSTGKENDSDLALHLNPRMDRRIVVRNHRISQKWGAEEIVSVQPFPFKSGKNFTVLIFIADEQFMQREQQYLSLIIEKEKTQVESLMSFCTRGHMSHIAINKIHFCAFSFRIPLRNITHLIVTGDITLNLINFSINLSYPPRIFTKRPCVVLPRTVDKLESKCEIRRKVSALEIGTRIEIFGRLKLLPRGFYVNLQQGLELWPHPLIPFHMNLRIHPPGTSKREHEIIFNSWSKGSWGKEKIITFCPFSPGGDFHIVIDYNSMHYLVQVNDKFLFKHRITEPLDLDTVFIYGDVIINKVILRSINPVDYAPGRSTQEL